MYAYLEGLKPGAELEDALKNARWQLSLMDAQIQHQHRRLTLLGTFIINNFFLSDIFPFM